MVQWLESTIEGRDITPKLHTKAPDVITDVKDQDGHNTGFTWIVGDNPPAPRVELTLFNATRNIDQPATDYMSAIEEFFQEAGLKESQARALPLLDSSQTGFVLTKGFCQSMADYEKQATSWCVRWLPQS